MSELKISTIMPVYVENILQTVMLERALESLAEQTNQAVQVVVSDNSRDPGCILNIKKICSEAGLNIEYFPNNELIGPAKNHNFAASHASAELIHILHQDDFIINKNLYNEVSEIFSSNLDIWLIAQGKVDQRILESNFDAATKFGFNELGGPSSLFVARKNFIPMNPEYRMMYDVINYHEYFLKMGQPNIIRGVNIQFGVHEYQLSNKVKSKDVFFELLRFIKSYNITGNEITTTVKLIKREIFHQRLLLMAGLISKKISFRFFVINYSISRIKSVKRKIFN
jgi:glycosyltransferase involved in cell wall biosynthesis